MKVLFVRFFFCCRYFWASFSTHQTMMLCDCKTSLWPFQSIIVRSGNFPDFLTKSRTIRVVAYDPLLPICLSPPKEINIQYSILLGSTLVQLISNKHCPGFICRSNFSVSLIVRWLCCVVHSQKCLWFPTGSIQGGRGDHLFTYQWAFCIFLLYNIFLLNSREGCVDCDHPPRWGCYDDGGMQMQRAVAPSIIATFCRLFSPLYPFNWCTCCEKLCSKSVWNVIINLDSYTLWRNYVNW